MMEGQHQGMDRPVIVVDAVDDKIPWATVTTQASAGVPNDARASLSLLFGKNVAAIFLRGNRQRDEYDRKKSDIYIERIMIVCYT